MIVPIPPPARTPEGRRSQRRSPPRRLRPGPRRSSRPRAVDAIRAPDPRYGDDPTAPHRRRCRRRSPSPSSSPPSSARAPAGRPPTPRPTRPSRHADGPDREHRPTDHPAPPRPRGRRLRAVLGDGRRDRRAPRAGRRLTTLALFSVTHTKDRRARHGADRLPADHGPDRAAAHPRGARPRGGRGADLHELRAGAKPAAARLGRAPGQDDRLAGGPRRRAPPRRHRRRHRAHRPRPRAGLRRVRRRGCAIALRAEIPKAQVSVSTGAGRTGAAMAAAAGGGRRRPDHPDGLRLPLRHVGRRRLGAAGPPRRPGRRPGLVARPVRVARRAGRPDHPRAAAVRDALASGRSRDRRAAAR